MPKRNLKILKHYIIGFSCIVFFYLIDNSSIIHELVQKSDKLRYKGFDTFILTGFIKYGLLCYGIGVIVIFSFFLIKEKILNKKKSRTNYKE